MPRAETQYKFAMDEFTAEEYGHVIATAQQVVGELNEGTDSLPSPPEGGVVYSAGTVSTLLLVLGVDRPIPVRAAVLEADSQALDLAFQGRFDDDMAERVAESWQRWSITEPDYRDDHL